MSKAALVQILERWPESHERDLDSSFLTRFLTQRDEDAFATFTPDGKFLAEGPTPGDNIQIRDVETRKVVQTHANGRKRSMNVPRVAYTQGGRVRIACDNITSVKEIAVPHSINLWDTASGSIAHQIALPAGLPHSIDVSPNGRYMAAMLDDGDSGMKLSVWRLDGEKPVPEPMLPSRPASVRPR
jgi:WD40 repeat protein